MLNLDLETVFVRFVVMLTALPIHECAHGLVASRLGDDTARHQGRLTLNPFVHLDLIGSFLLMIAGFGWAKPVPVNPRYFKHPRRDMAITALAGPVSNVLLALLALVVYRFSIAYMYMPAARALSNSMPIVLNILMIMIGVNLSLAVFNLLPVPPLDGSKIFGAFLPDKYYFYIAQYERYIFFGFLFLLMSGILDRPRIFLTQQLYNLLLLLVKPLDMLLGLL